MFTGKHQRFVALASCTLAACASFVSGQSWNVNGLAPYLDGDVFAHGIDGNMVVGSRRAGFGSPKAVMWNTATGTATLLGPWWASTSVAADASGSQQVGYLEHNGVSRASLWSGSESSWVDLSPAGANGSFASGVSNGEQVGRALFNSVSHAGKWSGTAASWTSLHPSGATSSYASGVHNGQQVGAANYGSGDRATLWTGSAASAVSLHPAGYASSRAWATSVAHQVGSVVVSGSTSRAAMWSGSASSFVDLHPAGAQLSEVLDVDGDYQVGYARFDGLDRAGVWMGSSQSWVDLGALITFEGAYSQATGISVAGDSVRVSGWWAVPGWDVQPVVFELVVPTPASAAVLLGAGVFSVRRRR